jgi:hypothetical protein
MGKPSDPIIGPDGEKINLVHAQVHVFIDIPVAGPQNRL